MALTDPKDTLAYHTSRVLTANRDMSGTLVSDVSAQVKKFMAQDKGKNTVPETEALWFYGLNHGMSLIQAEFAPLQPLPAGVLDYVNGYHKELAPKAVRAFYYLLLICTREFRHNKSLSSDAPKIKVLCGSAVGDFFTSVKGGESDIHKQLLDKPPHATIGAYVKALQWGFYNSSWSGGYGGKAWGQVTDCLVRFVTGEFTAEMMLDTIWTLCHNNGPIFNKGMLYSHYSSELVRILDIQRSGQIPEAVFEDEEIAGYVNDDLTNKMKYIDFLFPGKLGKYVNWYQVEALGSVHKYHSEKAAQDEKYGTSPEHMEMKKAADAAKKAAQAQKKIAELKKEQDKAEFALKHFEVMPGVFVEKIEINRAEAA
jgi:hypothetical protein